jgi:hypothetical protein
MANSTTNQDLDYIQKDFGSSLDALINFANVNYGPGTSANRLWTDFNTDSFSRNWLEIVAYIADVFFFYFDNQATQAYLQTATIRSAVLDIASQFGFSPASATSASGVAIFSINSAGTVLRGFRVRATNGEEFFLTNDIVASIAGDYSGTVLQGSIKTEQFTAAGIQNEEFDLIGPNVIKDPDNLNSADISPILTVAGNDYSLVNSFIRHNGTDTDAVTDSLGEIIGGGGRVFTLGLRPEGTPFIRFGDGIFGRKLLPGELISITYRTGGGTVGNIGAQTLTTLVDSNPIVTSVTNDTDFSGGADEQSIAQLRELIPASLRTLQRAVAEQDYSDILIANFTEVFDASAEVNTSDPTIDVNIYVVPQGIGIPKISDNTLLKNTLIDFIDRRKTVTVQFQILDAFGIPVLIELEVFVTSTASKTTVISDIKAALTDFFSLTTGGPLGTGITFATDILLKDIGNIIETVSGIERFEIKKLTYTPRIEENIVELVTDYQSSEVTVFPPVSESEWLLGAAGEVTEVSGTILFSNTGLISFTYTSSTGVIQYSTFADLSLVSPGDLFRDGAATDFSILAVDTLNNNVTLATGLTINNTVNDANDGSIRNGATVYESFKCFKKTNAVSTNLSANSITDNNLSLSVKTGTATALSARILLDNSQTFVPSEFSSGEYFLVDGAGNIWNIVANDSNTLQTGVTAINDASISSVTGGLFRIVINLTNRSVIFNDSIFTIQYNNHNTIFSVGAQFDNIGTIGDAFHISEEQNNVGTLGVIADLVSYDSSSGMIRLNGIPELEGVNSGWHLVDSSSQVFNISGVDNRAQPYTIYESFNQDDELELKGSGLGLQIGQGFQVPSTSVYSSVSFHLKREGNIVGNLIAKIVNDSSGFPNLSSVVATSIPVNVTDIDDVSYEKTVFFFTTPPTLTASTQYHLVLSGDTGYVSSQSSGSTVFNNTGLVAFTYGPISGVIQYASSVNLSSVLAGHFFQDGVGALFKILAVDDTANTVTLDTGLTVNTTVTTAADGAIIKNDRVFVGTDSSAPSYTNGALAQYDGFTWFTVAGTDAIFSVEGTKTITITSDLTPVLGAGATISERYYDDRDEISLILGISSGLVTSATDVTPIGTGTVDGNPGSDVDNFVFRTSSYSDDIVNLRFNEIPQLDEDDISILIFGGVD